MQTVLRMDLIDVRLCFLPAFLLCLCNLVTVASVFTMMRLPSASLPARPSADLPLPCPPSLKQPRGRYLLSALSSVAHFPPLPRRLFPLSLFKTALVSSTYPASDSLPFPLTSF